MKINHINSTQVATIKFKQNEKNAVKEDTVIDESLINNNNTISSKSSDKSIGVITGLSAFTGLVISGVALYKTKNAKEELKKITEQLAKSEDKVKELTTSLKEAQDKIAEATKKQTVNIDTKAKPKATSKVIQKNQKKNHSEKIFETNDKNRRTNELNAKNPVNNEESKKNEILDKVENPNPTENISEVENSTTDKKSKPLGAKIKDFFQTKWSEIQTKYYEKKLDIAYEKEHPNEELDFSAKIADSDNRNEKWLKSLHKSKEAFYDRLFNGTWKERFLRKINRAKNDTNNVSAPKVENNTKGGNRKPLAIKIKDFFQTKWSEIQTKYYEKKLDIAYEKEHPSVELDYSMQIADSNDRNDRWLEIAHESKEAFYDKLFNGTRRERISNKIKNIKNKINSVYNSFKQYFHDVDNLD